MIDYKTMLLLPALVLASACTQEARPEPAAPPPTEEAGVECDARGVQDLVGKTADAAVIEDARTRSGAKTVRAVGPDQAVTQDFRTDRLNIYFDARKVIARIGCG